jgi:hypothetical protein
VTFRWTTVPAEAATALFPPFDRALIQALASEVAAETEQPLSRQSLADLTSLAKRKDVGRGVVLGRCEAQTAIEAFGRLVDQILDEKPHSEAERLFLIVDNSSSHRDQGAVESLRARDRRLILMHTPVHASWLNRVDIYFSILQRKILRPSDFADLEALRIRILLDGELTNRRPRPFAWKLIRQELADWPKRASPHFPPTKVGEAGGSANDDAICEKDHKDWGSSESIASPLP